MPIYEYTCTDCRSDFEALVRNSDESTTCPSCGKSNLEKRFSVPAAHSSGSSSLNVVGPSGGGCGLPQCGMGGCGMM